MNDPMCNKRFLLHALLVNTLKKHMSAAVRMCGSYSVFWGFCGLGFSEFLKVLLWGLGGFFVVYFAYEGFLNYWNLLSIGSFCGIKLYCTDQKFPCWMQEDGLDGFFRSLQHLISATVFLLVLGCGSHTGGVDLCWMIACELEFVFAIWLPDN